MLKRPAWYPPKREVIHTATGDWCEAKCQEAEQAMAKAMVRRLEALTFELKLTAREKDAILLAGEVLKWEAIG